MLSGMERVYEDVSDRQRRSVDMLRGRKVSWEAIGKSLGVSRQAAWERFS
jgi:biotin operon repressor